MKKLIIALGAILFSVFTIGSCINAPSGLVAPPQQSNPVAAASSQPPAAGTAAQRNALRSAESYLEMQGFSRKGLIKQLKFEGYTEADATWAADHTGADWNAQAVRSAKSYLDVQGFSRSGLIKQLIYDGYAKAQAAHGATAVGLK